MGSGGGKRGFVWRRSLYAVYLLHAKNKKYNNYKKLHQCSELME
jgi:hypothetical protein